MSYQIGPTSPRSFTEVSPRGSLVTLIGGGIALFSFFALPYITVPLLGSLTGAQVANLLHSAWEFAQQYAQLSGSQGGSAGGDPSLLIWLQAALAAGVVALGGWQWFIIRQVGGRRSRGPIIGALVVAIIGVLATLYVYVSFQSLAGQSSAGQIAAALISFGLGYWLVVGGLIAASVGAIVQLADLNSPQILANAPVSSSVPLTDTANSGGSTSVPFMPDGDFTPTVPSMPLQAPSMPSTSVSVSPGWEGVAPLQASGASISGNQRRSAGMIALSATLLFAVIIGAFAVVSNWSRIVPSGGSTTRTNNTGSTTSPTAPQAAIPVGSLLYTASAPGQCDTQGGNWSQNPQANQQCDQGALVLNNPDCSCPLGVVTLASLPSGGYPTNYAVQVTAQPVGGAATAKFGFKFRQQSVSDTGSGRAGYSFLVDPNGQFQFNRYDSNGKRNILAQQQLPNAVTGTHTLNLVVKNATYSFYLDGSLLISQTDGTYSNGFFCLAVEPAANVYFHDLSLYNPA